MSNEIALLPADLLNVFETFLPQLLLYPNPTDPLNGEAAALLMREPEAYNAKVKGNFISHKDACLGACIDPGCCVLCDDSTCKVSNL